MNLSDFHVPSYSGASEQEVFRQWWWQREDLRYLEGHLFLGEQNLHSLAHSVGTPCYVYNSSRIKQNILRIHSALERASLRHRIFYAIKANRNPMLLTYIRSLGLTGVDCCSPNELLLGRQVGFLEEEISFTGVSVSDDDLAILTRHSGVFINCDSLSQIRRLGHLTPGREIGIRVNPNIGFSYNAASKLQYSGHKTTKFGIYKDSFLEALQLAAEYKLNVTGIHCHSGFGFLSKELPVLEMLLNEICWFVDQLKNPKYVNLGGGLGIPLVKDDSPLDLEAWARLIANYFAPKDLEVFVEPGYYIVKDSGVLLLQVTHIERKRDKTFVYVNGGYNLNFSSALYQLPLEVVPVLLAEQQDMNSRFNWIQVSIAGNINEAIDIFAEDIYLPALQEGDYLAFLNVGAYGSSRSSNHCMRGHFMEYLIYPKD